MRHTLLVVLMLAATSASAQPFAYVPNVLFSGGVTVLDLSTNTVVTTIPFAGLGLSAVAIHPSDQLVYVGGNDTTGTGAVGVIDATTNTAVTTITGLADNLTSIAMRADGARLYATAFTGGVHVIDTSTNTVVEVIALPGEHQSIAAHPDGTKLYVADFTGFVHVLSTPSHQLLTSIPIADHAEWIVVDGDGQRAFTTFNSPSTKGFVAIDTATDSILYTKFTTQFLGDLATTCDRVWGTDVIAQAIEAFDAETGNSVGTVAVATRVMFLDAQSDGSRVYATSLDDDVVVGIDTSTMSVLDQIPATNAFAIGDFITGPHARCAAIFADGFESGDTAAWSSVVP